MSNDLEQAFRDGLRRAADRAETAVPLAQRARSAAGVRRRRRRTVVASAAASVVAVAGVTVAVQLGTGGPERGNDTAVATTPGTTVTAWRAESWGNLTVDVPADWGWGTAPIEMSVDAGRELLCGGPGAMVTADGHNRVNERADVPWVGRPIMLSDSCLAAPYPTPQASYVWLGADLAPGSVDLGDGWTQETVEAFGTTLTVGTDDPGLGRQILGSARETTGCLPALDSAPEIQAIPIEGLDPVHSAQVCAYRKADAGYELAYATTLDRATAAAMYAGEGQGGKSAPEFCAADSDEYVQITFSGRDPMGTADLTQQMVIDPGCQELQVGPGYVVPLTDAGMQAWSRNGLQAVLFAFIGMLG